MMRRLLLLITIVFLSRCAAAAEEPADPQDAARQERLRYMTELFGEFQLSPRDEPERALDRTAEPLLRWSNPVRNSFSDGATFLWLDGERPVAAATMSIRGNGAAWREFVTLSDQPIRCLRNGQAVWMPDTGSLTDQPLTDAPEPASSPPLRLAQLRRLARRFTVIMSESETKPDEIKSLRLLAQPVYRYSDEQAGVVDGAVFAFCETTDPEALLMIEAFRPSDAAAAEWRFTPARMTSRPLVYRLDDREILSLKGYWANPRTLADPFIEVRLGRYEPGGSSNLK
ncbi:MAG: hypothetical protein ACREJB_12165 [Planctomycetaceae bacterium]